MTKLMLHTPTAREELEKIARQNLQVAQNKKATDQQSLPYSSFVFVFLVLHYPSRKIRVTLPG